MENDCRMLSLEKDGIQFGDQTSACLFIHKLTSFLPSTGSPGWAWGVL